MWIVMTSSAKSPGYRAMYRNIALVRLDEEYTARYIRTYATPKMISIKAKGVLQIEHLGLFFVGKTVRSAYHQKIHWANQEVASRNAIPSSLSQTDLTPQPQTQTPK